VATAHPAPEVLDPAAPTRILGPDELVQAAVEETGLTDLGPGHFREPLRRLVAALRKQARLNEGGCAQVNEVLRSRLVNRLLLTGQERAHPAIAEIEVARPVVIVGLHRTGSTYAHNLLGLHPQLSAPAAWEFVYPVTPPGRDEGGLIAECHAAFTAVFEKQPRFRAIHDMDAQAPDECRWLLNNEFCDLTEATIEYHVPDFTRWLLAADLTAAYRGHRRQLQHILWRKPRAGRLLLKNPGHVWHLPELMETYPDARLVVLHRNPVQAIASACSLSMASRSRTSDRVEPADIGRERADLTLAALRALAGFRGAATAPAGQILDIRYEELRRDPVTVAARVYDFLGLPMTGRVRAAVRGYASANPQHRHGPHRYQLDRFGLDAAALAAEHADYVEQFC
jgi:hypothetical protein